VLCRNRMPHKGLSTARRMRIFVASVLAWRWILDKAIFPRTDVGHAAVGYGLRAMQSISTSALRASPVTPTQVRAGKRPSGK